MGIDAGCSAGYLKKHAQVTPEGVVDFLVRDADNPSSVLSCFETARRNARTVCTALTADMWEVLNDTWLELKLLETAGGIGESIL